MTRSELYVHEAIDLEPTEDDYQEPPLADVTWPDGRVDALPHTCVEADIGASDIGAPLLHLGHINLAGGMTSGYFAADLARVGRDTYFTRVGDVDGDAATFYLRGPLPLVVDNWLGSVDYNMMPLQWRAFASAHFLGLLAAVPSHEGSYGAPLFEESAAPHGPTHNDLMFLRSSLAPSELSLVKPVIDESAPSWPQRVAHREAAPLSAWLARVDAWQRWLEE